MKKARIIIGCIFAAIAVAINAGVAITWASSGVSVSSIIMGVVFYSTAITSLWYTIDSTIREANQ